MPDLRRPVVLSPLLALAVALQASTPPVSPPPPTLAAPRTENVLLVIADDLGVEMLAAYGAGSDQPSLPVIDGLAAQGVLFRRAYAAPTCSPTRAAIQTGRFGFRTGIGSTIGENDTISLLPDELILPELLDAGTGGAWSHAYFGKWHLSGDEPRGDAAPNDAGWAHFAGSLHNLDARGSTDYYDWLEVVDGLASTSQVYATTSTVDSALGWLDGAAEPWLVTLAFNAPHSPWQAPPEGLYSTDLSAAGDPGRDPRPYYKAMTEALDSELGRLLASLDADVLARTTVVFLGDNGTPGPVVAPPLEPGKVKGTVFEGGVHVPLIVTGPRVAAPGSECAAFVQAVDVFASVAEIAGVDLASVLPGVTLDALSFVPYLGDPSLPGQRPQAFCERFDPNKDGGLDPPDFLCQPELGAAGPGAAQLGVCGQPLYAGNSATLQLAGGPPDALAYLLLSAAAQPQPFAGGVLLATPWLALLGLTLDGAGQLAFEIPGGPDVVPGADALVMQAVVTDPGLPLGWSVSNGVQVHWLAPPESRRALRDDVYKYVVRTTHFVDGDVSVESLYDLAQDPLELHDLLANGGVAGLAPEPLAAYLALEAALAALLATGP